MRPPTRKKLQDAWLELKDIHKTYLDPYGVKLPKAKHYSDRIRSIWLAALYHYRDTGVHKDDISKIVQRDKPGRATDQQVRHLRDRGWDIGDDPGFHKLNPYRPCPTFLKRDARRRSILAAKSFEELKEIFENQCATCGAAEGQQSPRYGGEKVALHRGHRDPRKPGDDMKNIIPQCQFCNKPYKNDFTFDENGRVDGIASLRPVKRADENLQREILDFLKKKYEK